MTKAEHLESKRITDAATPGAWSVEDPIDGELQIVEASKQTYEWRFIASFIVEDPDFKPDEVRANAEFCSHARAALPAYQQALEEAMELLRHAWDDLSAYRRAQAFLKRWDGDDGTGTDEN